MKYIITESRLHEIIKDYLDTFIEFKDVSYPSSYVVISQRAQTDDQDTWVDYMEYDYQDGRLWINKDFLTNIADLFFRDKKEASEFISEWFEEKFDVDVEFVE